MTSSIKSEFNRQAPASPEMRKKIAMLYKAGVSTEGLGIRFGRYGKGSQLKLACKEHGVPMRGRVGQRFMSSDPQL